MPKVLGETSTREKFDKALLELDSLQVTRPLQKEAAKRRDTARIYTEAGKSGRVTAEVPEAEGIEAYIPKPLTRSGVESSVDEVVATLQADGQEITMRRQDSVECSHGVLLARAVQVRLGYAAAATPSGGGPTAARQ
ncbi:GatB/YqeY domain-containing protein [Arthrobacter sp. TMN-37]